MNLDRHKQSAVSSAQVLRGIRGLRYFGLFAVGLFLSQSPAGVLAGSFPVSIQTDSSNAVVQWQGEAGARYQIEFRTNIRSGSWSIMVSNQFSPTEAPTEFIHTNALLLPAGFYRVALVPDPPPFQFQLNGTNFTYSDSNRTFTGVFVKPDGPGPFPGLIINHGAGGSANGYSLGKAREISPWGMVCIAPNLTHAAGGETNPVNMGFCPENLARITACANVLASLDYVDTNRLAILGHSMGAFASIGSSATLAGRLKAGAITAGGVIPDSAGDTNAAPTVSEADPVRTPFLMIHCDADTVVLPIRSLLFQDILNSNAVPNQRIVINSNSVPNPMHWHNLHQDAAMNALILTNTRAWFELHGALP